MNEKTIWDYLFKKTNNPYGTAGIMGNLMAESSLAPVCATNMKKAGYDNISRYVADSDSGAHDFAHDGVAFGLVQWCYSSRKQGLLDLARSKNMSVGDIGIQLDYLWKELQSYKTVLNAVCTATSVREASDIVMTKYEKPANQSEAMKKRRADYGQKYFDQFASQSAGEQKKESTPSGNMKNVVANVNVNIRTGDSTSFSRLGSIKAGTKLEWVATAANGWHAVRYNGKVAWVSGEFTRLES